MDGSFTSKIFFFFAYRYHHITGVHIKVTVRLISSWHRFRGENQAGANLLALIYEREVAQATELLETQLLRVDFSVVNERRN